MRVMALKNVQYMSYLAKFQQEHSVLPLRIFWRGYLEKYVFSLLHILSDETCSKEWKSLRCWFYVNQCIFVKILRQKRLSRFHPQWP